MTLKRAGILVALGLVLAAAAPWAGPAAAAPLDGAAPEMVAMEAFNGAFVVAVNLDNVLDEKFIVDSGAADVSIPSGVAERLKRSGAMTAADFLGQKVYMMADGSKVPSDIYRLASLKIGGLVMRNVTVRVAGENTSPLLGQSFLSRLKSWSMDNVRQVMVFN